MAKTSLPQAAFQGKNNYVYKTEYNFFDIAVDENGLWVIYGDEYSQSHLLVSKLNPADLSIEKTWNLTVEHQSYGNGFISCGILYLVKDTQTKNTVIDYAYDLYEKKFVEMNRMKFTNPFQMNNMLSYYPVEEEDIWLG